MGNETHAGAVEEAGMLEDAMTELLETRVENVVGAGWEELDDKTAELDES